MANMLYNGVELPDIETVWTDKESYPYAVLIDMGSFCFLYLTSLPALYTSSPYYVGGTVRHIYLCITDTAATEGTDYTAYTWIDQGATTLDSIAYVPTNGVLFWTNHNIVNNTDYTIYLAASEPVDPNASTFDKKSYISGFLAGLLGRGMIKGSGAEQTPVAYIYNDVQLPVPPVYDKTEFPYAFIEYYGTPVYATLFVTNVPLGIWDYGDGIGESMGPEGGTSATWKYMKCRLVQADNAVTDPIFGSVIETSNPSWVTASDVLWANYDVPNYVDGGTLLSASDPIPVYE